MVVPSTRKCSLEECAEKLRQPSLWTELAMFERIMYKNNNQHRCTLYFQRLRAVRQGMNLLRKVGLYENLQDLCIKLRSRPGASSAAAAASSSTSSSSFSSSPSDEEYALVRNVLKRLWAGAKLMSRVNRAALIAAARVATLLASQNFGRMATIAFACLSRFHVLLSQMTCDTVPAYNLLVSTVTEERGFDPATLLEDPKPPPPGGHFLDQWHADRLLPVKLEVQVSKPESVGVKAVFDDSTKGKPKPAGDPDSRRRGGEPVGIAREGGGGGVVGLSRGSGDGGPHTSRGSGDGFSDPPSGDNGGGAERGNYNGSAANQSSAKRGRGDGGPHPSRGSGDGGEPLSRRKLGDGERGNVDGSAANRSRSKRGRGEKRGKRALAGGLQPTSEADESLADVHRGLQSQEKEDKSVSGQRDGSNATRVSPVGAGDTCKKRKVVTPVGRSGGKGLSQGHLPKDWRFLEKDG